MIGNDHEAKEKVLPVIDHLNPEQRAPIEPIDELLVVLAGAVPIG